MKKHLLLIFTVVICSFYAPTISHAQVTTIIPVSYQGTTYNNAARGFWFISPANFIISGLRVPDSTAGAGKQDIQLIRIHDPITPFYPNYSTNFDVIFDTADVDRGILIPVHITINAGDTIGVLGELNSTVSYSPSFARNAQYLSLINGNYTEIHRLVYSNHLGTSAIDSISMESAGNFGRVEVYYLADSTNDMGVDSLLSPSAPYCSGFQNIVVLLKNYGANVVDSVLVTWRMNNTDMGTQSVYFAPPLPPHKTDTFNLGIVSLPYQTPVHFKAWTSLPNGVPDTFNYNDTLSFDITPTRHGVTDTIIPGDTSICQGHSLTLDAQNPGATYQWNTSDTTKTIDAIIDKDTVFWAKISISGKCSFTDSVHVSILPAAHIDTISFFAGIQGNYSFTAVDPTNVDTFEWFFGDGVTGSDTAYVEHTYTRDGTDTVTLIVTNPCGSDTSQVIIKISGLGIGEINLSHNQLRLYPNPATNVVQISNKSPYKMETIKVYNILGQEVFAGKADQSDIFKLNTQNYPSGIYSLRIYFEDGNWITRKFEVRK